MLPHSLTSAVRTMNDWPTPISMVDCNRDDAPLVFVNPAFSHITGYAAEEALGRNCRFLQGHETQSDIVRDIRQAISDRRAFDGCLRNYRKDGAPFDNFLFITPIGEVEGTDLIIGFQFPFAAGVTKAAVEEHREMIVELLQHLRVRILNAGTLMENIAIFDPRAVIHDMNAHRP